MPVAARTNDIGSTEAVILRPTRMVYDPRTTECIDRHMSEGKTKKEAVRCLKRYVAREVYGLLPHDKLGLDNP